jgi:ABC-type histidine transport system ATPase subunit
MHIDDWWDKAAQKVAKPMKRQFNGLVIYTIWNIWKERNRRIFNNTLESPMQVASKVREDIMQRKRVSLERG